MNKKDMREKRGGTGTVQAASYHWCAAVLLMHKEGKGMPAGSGSFGL